MQNDNFDSFFENTWEELRHWPYTIHQIDDTLDSRLIEGRGKQILFQALNAGLLTAFVGSGVSAAYGRMGWSEWKEAQLSVVSEGCEKFQALADASLRRLSDLQSRMKLADEDSNLTHETKAHWRVSRRWLQHRRQITEQARWEINKLDQTFKASSSDKGSFPGGEDLPIQFEIAKKLHELLLRHSRLFFPVDNGKLSSEQQVFFGTRCEAHEGAPIKSLEEVFASYDQRQTYKMNVGKKEFVDLFETFERFTDRPEVQMPFDKLAKHYLVDECAHALNLFNKAFVSGTEYGRTLEEDDVEVLNTWRKSFSLSEPGNLKRDIDGIRDEPKRYRVLSPFRIKQTSEYATHISETAPRPWQSIMSWLSNRLVTYTSDQSPLLAERVFLTPTSRFLFTVLCQLDETPLHYWKDDSRLGSTEIGKQTPLAPEAAEFKSRRSIMADRFDPLAKTIGNLNIKNYLTTNYDFEIERQFVDRGYRQFDDYAATPAEILTRSNRSDRSFRVNGLGGSLNDVSFSAETATDILSFAAGAGSAEASVFHLHGRATETDTIVATERDYMDQYLRDVPNREVIDESILMAFGANPILFLGLGMEEADVLRPLRQFISDHDRYVGYRSIVLLPASKDFESRAKTSAGLYMRYGAHTIFFGGGDIALDIGGKHQPQPIDWLYRMSALIGALDKATKKQSEDLLRRYQKNSGKLSPGCFLEDLPEYKPAPITAVADLAKSVGTIGDDLKSKTTAQDPDYPALAVILGIQKNQLLRMSRLKPDRPPFKRELATLELKNCNFTTRRHGSGDMLTGDRQIKIDGSIYTGFYIELLTRLLRLALRQPESETIGETLRSLNAMRTALSGIKAGLMTATLNAALDGIHKEWRHWWRDWQQSPPQREAAFEIILPPEQKSEPDGHVDTFRHELIFPRRFIRHRLINVITDVQHAVFNTAPALVQDHRNLVTVAKSDAGLQNSSNHLTRVRVFDTFIYDVKATQLDRSVAHGRLMHTLAAGRGQGKGVAFSVFSTRLGLSSYIRAAHPSADISQGTAKKPFLIGAIFINLGFAPEVASVMDMTKLALVDIVARTRALSKSISCKTDNKTIGKIALELFLQSKLADSLTADQSREVLPIVAELDQIYQEQEIKLKKEIDFLPRTEAIRTLLQKFALAANHFRFSANLELKLRPRFLICLHTAELLFDSRRRPKNMEIADFLETFMGDGAKEIPFDLVVIGDLQGIGRRKMPRLVAADRRDEEIAENYRSRVKSLAKMHEVPTSTRTSGRPEDFNFVHFAREIDPIVFLVDNFLPLAIALFLNRNEKAFSDGRLDDETIDALQKSGREAIGVCIDAREKKWAKFDIPHVNLVYRDTHYQMVSSIIDALANSGIKSGCKDKTGNEVPWLVEGDNAKQRRHVGQLLTEDYKKQKNGAHPAQISDVREWEDAAHVFGGNRFSLTVLMAAAQHVALSDKHLSSGGHRADIILKDVVSRVRNVSVSGREAEVLKAVMSIYEEASIIGDPDHDHELHLHLLRNIAVLGCPVSPNVLVRLPDIRDYFNRVEMKVRISRRRMVAQALATLSERGLVFRISPHPKLLRLEKMFEKHGGLKNQSEEDLRAYFKQLLLKDQTHEDAPLKDLVGPFKKWAPHLEYRYGLHRQVQNYCFQRLGHLTAQPISANSFAPSLYTSMPSKVVRLSREGYLFLRRLLLGLSQYPDIRQGDSARDIPIFRDDDIITRVQALRAGLSLARNSFSISAVSRFSDDSTGSSFVRKRGYFETYRVRLRWLLRKAWEIHEPRILNDPNNLRVNALYRDEIIWLYNEVAVTCLVQGSLVEAIGHARQAISLNTEIEGKVPGGRMYNMLSLNLAIMQLERGRLSGAERRLREICAAEVKHQHRVYWLASGYRALIAQLQGRQQEAEEGFKNAINNLRTDSEDRALALMYLHLGRLVARRDVVAAKRALSQARDYAETGGHEDVRHRVMVSEVWISQTFEEGKLERQQHDRIKLQEIENYARMMGMYSLLVETLHAQGRMLLESGDNSSSGKLMTRAMAIARRHDQTLRLNALMTDYAKILMARRRFGSAARLLNSALVMAKRSGYSTAVVRIHAELQAAEAATQVG
ncbi:MAG: SIR2 family protein [Pseudomonadota bacterium]